MEPQRARDEELIDSHTVYEDDGSIRQPKKRPVPKKTAEKPAANDAVYQQRRTSPDRSDLSKPDATRKVRSTPVTSSSPIDNLNYTTTDERFRKEMDTRGVRPEFRDGQPTGKASVDPNGVRGVSADRKNESRPEPGRKIRVPRRKRKKKKKRNIVSKMAAKLRATVANSIILAVVLGTYMLQFWVAVLNILMFGVIVGWDALTIAKSGDSSLVKLGKGGLRLLEAGIESATSVVRSVFGLDPTAISPAKLWFITEVAILGYAVFLVLFSYLVYKLFFLNPFSGRAAGLKMGSMILIFFGYFVPVLNLFPWILVWTSVVWLRPK